MNYGFWSKLRSAVDFSDMVWQVGWRGVSLVLYSAFTAVFIKEFL